MLVMLLRGVGSLWQRAVVQLLLVLVVVAAPSQC
jgi:hypothetical protein